MLGHYEQPNRADTKSGPFSNTCVTRNGRYSYEGLWYRGRHHDENDRCVALALVEMTGEPGDDRIDDIVGAIRDASVTSLSVGVQRTDFEDRHGADQGR